MNKRSTVPALSAWVLVEILCDEPTTSLQLNKADFRSNQGVTHQDLGMAMRLPALRGAAAPEKHAVLMHGQFVCSQHRLSRDGNRSSTHA